MRKAVILVFVSYMHCTFLCICSRDFLYSLASLHSAFNNSLRISAEFSQLCGVHCSFSHALSQASPCSHSYSLGRSIFSYISDTSLPCDLSFLTGSRKVRTLSFVQLFLMLNGCDVLSNFLQPRQSNPRGHF